MSEKSQLFRLERDVKLLLIGQDSEVLELIVGEGFNHFEMQETLGNPYGIGGRAALKLMGLSVN